LPYYALVRLSGASNRMLRVCAAARTLTVPFPTEAKLQVTPRLLIAGVEML
jgi:hypothetical protein